MSKDAGLYAFNLVTNALCAATWFYFATHAGPPIWFVWAYGGWYVFAASCCVYALGRAAK